MEVWGFEMGLLETEMEVSVMEFKNYTEWGLTINYLYDITEQMFRKRLNKGLMLNESIFLN